MLKLRIGDVWAHTLGETGIVGNVEMKHAYATSGSGLLYLKWSMDLPRNYWSTNFREGTKVEAYRGDVKLGTATMTEVDRTNWNFTADGLFRRAETFYPDDSNTQTAMTNANLRGLGWNGIGDLPAGIFPVAEVNSQTSIAEHLTKYCRENSLRWGLTVEDVPFVEAEPYLYDPATKPQWAITPGIPLMPTTDGSYVSRVRVTYSGGVAVSNTPVDANITPDGGREVSLSSRTSIGSEAQAQANEILRRLTLRYTFTEGLTIGPGDLSTPGGTPIDNWAASMLVLGKMGVHYGAASTRNFSAVGETVQWVAGSTTYKPADDSLVLASVDAEERTLGSVLASFAGIGNPADRGLR